MQRCDCIHHAITQPRVKIFSSHLYIGCGEQNRFSDYNRDWHKPKGTPMPRQRFMGTKDPHWYDRCERFRNEKTDSRLRWLQGAVERARAFWKN